MSQVDGKIKLAMEKAEAEMAKANGQTNSNKLKIDSHIERATLTSRLLKGTGGLLRKDYVEVDEKEEQKALKAKDYTSLLARIKHGGKTKDELAKKVDAKKQWETNVKEEGYKPDPKKIAESLGMFVLYQVVDEMIERDVVKEASANDMFNESLGGRFFNYSKGKKPTYKAARRFGNALDYAKGEEGGGDDGSTTGGSLVGLRRIERLSEIENTKTAEEKEDDKDQDDETKRKAAILDRALANRAKRTGEGGADEDEDEDDEGSVKSTQSKKVGFAGGEGDDGGTVLSKKKVGFASADGDESSVGGETLGSLEESLESGGSPDSAVKKKKKKKKKKKDKGGGIIDRSMTSVMRDEDYDHDDPLMSSLQHRASLARKVHHKEHADNDLQMHFAD